MQRRGFLFSALGAACSYFSTTNEVARLRGRLPNSNPLDRVKAVVDGRDVGRVKQIRIYDVSGQLHCTIGAIDGSEYTGVFFPFLHES